MPANGEFRRKRLASSLWKVTTWQISPPAAAPKFRAFHIATQQPGSIRILFGPAIKNLAGNVKQFRTPHKPKVIGRANAVNAAKPANSFNHRL